MTGPLNLRRHPKAEPVADPAADPRLDEGVHLFNEGHHWHAHEAWEPLWMGLEGDAKLFLQGHIMAAALLVQYKKGVAKGVLNHWANVVQRLPRGASRWGLSADALLDQLAPYASDAEQGRPLARDVVGVQLRRAPT
jgi:hypothetical protein